MASLETTFKDDTQGICIAVNLIHWIYLQLCGTNNEYFDSQIDWSLKDSWEVLFHQ